jgi:hypothetical protein
LKCATVLVIRIVLNCAIRFIRIVFKWATVRVIRIILKCVIRVIRIVLKWATVLVTRIVLKCATDDLRDGFVLELLLLMVVSHDHNPNSDEGLLVYIEFVKDIRGPFINTWVYKELHQTRKVLRVRLACDGHIVEKVS